MIYISNIEPQENGSTYLKYTIKFQGSNHVLDGSFTATKDESTEAFKVAGAWQGFKDLITKKISNDISNLKGSEE